MRSPEIRGSFTRFDSASVVCARFSTLVPVDDLGLCVGHSSGLGLDDLLGLSLHSL
jgi:hypothetical protein